MCIFFSNIHFRDLIETETDCQLRAKNTFFAYLFRLYLTPSIKLTGVYNKKFIVAGNVGYIVFLIESDTRHPYVINLCCFLLNKRFKDLNFGL